MSSKRIAHITCLSIALAFPAIYASAKNAELAADSKPVLTIKDVMAFRQIEQTVVADNGKWIALSADPDRGDAEGLVYQVGSKDSGGKTYRIDRGESPQISAHGEFVLFKQAMSLVDSENLSKKEKKKWLPSWQLIDTANDQVTGYEHYQSAQLGQKGQWLALLKPYVEPEESDSTDSKVSEDSSTKADEGAEKKSFKPKAKDIGGELLVIHLISGRQYQINQVNQYAISPSGQYLSYSVANADALNNSVQIINLSKQAKSRTNYKKEDLSQKQPFSSEYQATLKAGDYGVAGHIYWHPEQDKLAFSWGNLKKDKKKRQLALYRWAANKKRVYDIDWKHADWSLFANDQLSWSANGDYLYIGLSPEKAIAQWDAEEKNKQKPDSDKKGKKDEKDKKSAADVLDPEKLAVDKGLTLWHINDPYIKPREQKRLEDKKNKSFWFAYQWSKRKTVQLSQNDEANLSINKHSRYQVEGNQHPYSREMLYDGYYQDYYRVDSKTGKKALIVKHLNGQVLLSPNGRYALYYQNSHFHLVDIKKQKTTNMTAALKVSFADELHDYPSAPDGYPIIQWTKDSKKVYVRDRYDIWAINAGNAKIKSMTKGFGRDNHLVLNPMHTDSEQPYIDPKQDNWLINAYSDTKKNYSIYSLNLDAGDLQPLLLDNKAYQFKFSPKNSDTVFFTQEDFQQFPDIWATAPNFEKPVQVTQVNPQIAQFQWGQKPELIEWTSTKGKPLQGVLIKPANYQPGTKVPVVVYYYRYFSQRMYQFNKMEVNHRPNFPLYTSNGYAIFLPDVKFDTGMPGSSATQALVPGIQKLIDSGVADPDAIGLHGHSWSGYQTAFVITQTDMFKAAVAGAPVTNMTSAYSGIRLSSGFARQFQYEQGQSRIGQSLNQARELYIENSPVFFADRINTPLMMMFGDVDGAVPWQQGIELYLAMRREEKDVIFLQYHDEPHHLKKYPNKVDYTQKMMEYFDYHLKGHTPKQWIIKGEAIKEKDK
jgi:dipeptidyl aminopeptidase/acylaminoacyl peptidase